MTTVALPNPTSDMLRRMIERQKMSGEPQPTSMDGETKAGLTGTGTRTLTNTPTTGGSIPTTVTGDQFGPGSPSYPVGGGGLRPIDPGFWNPGRVPGGGGTMQPMQPAVPPTPTTSDFGPGDNMIGKQIDLPNASREDLVQRMFNAMTPEMDRQAGVRREDLGRRIGALGRAGMGDVNTSFGNLEALESQRRSELLGKLSAEGAAGDINDMFKRADFMRGERGYQHGLDREGIADQQMQAAILAQLGYGFDPTQSGNFTNALMNSANASQSAANANAGQWGNLANLGTQMFFR